LPPKLRQILDQESGSLLAQAENALESQGEAGRGNRRLQCRSGRRAKLIASKSFDELALLAQENGTAAGVVGQCLRPKVIHRGTRRPGPGAGGRARPMKAVGRGAVMRTGPRARVFDSLLLKHSRQGALVFSTPEAKGLGKHFFVEQTGNAEVRQLLLIRLAVSQHDDLFAPDQLAAPVATP
jgi:hypothetical protein